MVAVLAKMMGVENFSADQKRSAYGKLCGGVGIFLNILLFIGITLICALLFSVLNGKLFYLLYPNTIHITSLIEIRYFFLSPAIYQASHFLTLYHILRKISRLSQKNKSL